MEIRVRPADFARMVEVSKQTVSQWIKKGIINIGVDGRLNPKEAARQVVQNTDPGRLRARLLKPLVNDTGALRRRICEQDADLAYLNEFVRNLDCGHERLLELIGQNWDTLRKLESGAIGAALRELDDRASLDCEGGNQSKTLGAGQKV